MQNNNSNYLAKQIETIGRILKNKMLFLAILSITFLFAPNVKVSALGYDWQETGPKSAAKGWSAEASSSDGLKLIAAAYNNGLYLSMDGGATWAQTGPKDGGSNFIDRWANVASSSDGLTLFALNEYQKYYLSTDGGATWAQTGPKDGGGQYLSKEWQGIAMSADGRYLIVSDYNNPYDSNPSGRLYLSTDRGTTWTETGPKDGGGNYANKHWVTTLSSNSDGAYLYAGEGDYYSAGRLYVSTDSGLTWVETGPKDGGGNYINRYWGGISSSSNGKYVLAANNSALYTSDDFGATWAASVPAGSTGTENWYGISVSGDGSHLIASASYNGKSDVHDGRIYVSTDHGASWIETQPAGNTDQYWTYVASSVDGLQLITSVWDGDLYTSADGGLHWREIKFDPAHFSNFWEAITFNSDGTQLFAGDGDGQLYHSTDSGETWSKTGPYTSGGNWNSLASSASGQHAVGANDEMIQISDDFGFTWQTRVPTGSTGEYWVAVTMSADGKRLLVRADSSRMFRSSDGGATWVETGLRDGQGNFITGQDWWGNISASADGKYVITTSGGDNNKTLYTSDDFGATWAASVPAGSTGTENWYGISVSGDGSHLIASASYNGKSDVHDGRIYVSTDHGASWIETQPVGNTDQPWVSVAASFDGLHLIASIQNGRIYTSANGGATWSETRPTGNTDCEWSDFILSSDGVNVFASDWGRLYRGTLPQPINPGPTVEKFQKDVTNEFLSIEGSNPTQTPKVIFNTQYTITNGDVKIVFPAGTEMTKTDGGNFDLSNMTAEDIATALKNTNSVNIAGAITIGIPNLKLSFSKDITVTIPVDSSYEGKTLNIWFQNANETIWNPGPICTVQNSLCIFQANHATTYSAGDQPVGAVIIDTPEQAEINDWSAYLFQDSSKCATKLKLNLEGKHFSNNTEIKIGNTKAAAIDKKSSQKIKATFCLEKLLNVKTDLTRKITATNPNTDSSKAKDKIDLQIVFAKFSETDFDTLTQIGITNVQQALIKLKLLNANEITGSYDQATSAAITNFQTQNQIPATGLVGPLTKIKLVEKYRRAL